ncbi:MAG: D-tyrosyl-tRNA(Tyr) deacylase [Fibrobacter sp.]|nr:D-tyrosyl-tRNA(Tyr) deacylase [Fibrobacter sp.]
MRIIIQRVSSASVTVDDKVVGAINKGVLLLFGVHKEDTEEKADYLAAKCAELRIFQDSDEKMNLALKDIDGEALVVSQFTLFGDCSKGRRPSFIEAAPPEKGKYLYEYFVEQLKKHLRYVATGIFGAHMMVELTNDGPVTLILER